jgi:hypothetical protein
MNQLPQSAVVAAEGYSALKGMLNAPADGTLQLTIEVMRGVGRKNSLAADRTYLAGYGMNRIQTLGTHRQAGNIQQRQAANAAIGRKQNREKTCRSVVDPGYARNVSLYGSNGKPSDCYVANPDLVLATAEDGLLRTRGVMRRDQSSATAV